MKLKIAALFMALLLVGTGQAMAKQMNVGMTLEQTMEWSDNLDFTDGAADGGNEDDFASMQYLTMDFQYITDENLRAVVSMQIDTVWGKPDTGVDGDGGAIGTDGGKIGLLHAYTDFNVAGINWRTGLQPLALPSATYGSPVLDSDAAAVAATYSFNENVSLTAAWSRLEDKEDGQDSDDVDMVTMLLPLTMDGWEMTPFASYALLGKDTDLMGESSLTGPAGTALSNSLTGLWAGAALGVSAYDPITFGLDLTYGAISGDEDDANDRSGWFVAALAQYKLESCTPGLTVFYGSGEDDDVNNGSEVLPTLDGGFSPTHFGFDGNLDSASGGLLGSRTDIVGIGLVIDDLTFIENLSHRVALLYGRGTSSKEMGDLNTGAANDLVLTEEDSFWELNLDTTYTLYENLSLMAQVGYLAVDWDDDTWANAAERDDAMKVSFTLTYEF